MGVVKGIIFSVSTIGCLIVELEHIHNLLLNVSNPHNIALVVVSMVNYW